MRKKIFLYIALISVISIELFSQEHLKRVSLQLNWKHQFEFAGFYMAKEKGFYKDAGLDVEIRELKSNTNVTKEVLSGRATFGIGYPTLILNSQP